MHRKTTHKLPTDTHPRELACRFSAYFTSKVDQIRSDLVSNQTGPIPSPITVSSSSDPTPPPSPTLETLRPSSEDEIAKIIKRSPPKSCPLDPLPTLLVQTLNNSLVVSITRLINMSFESGQFPDSFKTALITPVIKKESLDCNDLKNYRPISNLSFVSKVTEKVVAARLNAHLFRKPAARKSPICVP
jgi:hypothetical protein